MANQYNILLFFKLIFLIDVSFNQCLENEDRTLMNWTPDSRRKHWSDLLNWEANPWNALNLNYESLQQIPHWDLSRSLAEVAQKRPWNPANTALFTKPARLPTLQYQMTLLNCCNRKLIDASWFKIDMSFANLNWNGSYLSFDSHQERRASPAQEIAVQERIVVLAVERVKVAHNANELEVEPLVEFQGRLVVGHAVQVDSTDLRAFVSHALDQLVDLWRWCSMWCSDGLGNIWKFGITSKLGQDIVVMMWGSYQVSRQTAATVLVDNAKREDVGQPAALAAGPAGAPDHVRALWIAGLHALLVHRGSYQTEDVLLPRAGRAVERREGKEAAAANAIVKRLVVVQREPLAVQRLHLLKVVVWELAELQRGKRNRAQLALVDIVNLSGTRIKNNLEIWNHSGLLPQLSFDWMLQDIAIRTSNCLRGCELNPARREPVIWAAASPCSFPRESRKKSSTGAEARPRQAAPLGECTARDILHLSRPPP